MGGTPPTRAAPSANLLPRSLSALVRDRSAQLQPGAAGELAGWGKQHKDFQAFSQGGVEPLGQGVEDRERLLTADKRHSRRRKHLCKGPEAREHVITSKVRETEMRLMERGWESVGAYTEYGF